MNIWETDTFLARWLSNELSPEEKEAFEKSEEFLKFQKIKTTMEQYEAPEYNEEAALQKAMDRIQEQPKSGRVIPIRKLVQYAAAASVLLVACFAIYITLLSDEIVELKAAQQEEINLPDGSIVALSEGSSVKYNASDWSEDRTIELQGEAFFEVEKGETFQVKLARGTVSVLGTSFNILEKTNGLEVVCYTGKVKVAAYDTIQILEAGQSVLLQVGSLQLDSVYLNEPIWVDKVASYRKVKLNKVIQHFEQLYDLKVVGEYNGDLLYTGDFPTEDVLTAAELIFAPYNIKYHYTAQTKELVLLNE